MRMNHRQGISLLLVTFLLMGSVHAQIYKCKQPDGDIEFSNLPCAKGSSTIKMLPIESISEQARLEAERKVAQMRKDADRLEATRREAASSQVTPKQPPISAEPNTPEPP